MIQLPRLSCFFKAFPHCNHIPFGIITWSNHVNSWISARAMPSRAASFTPSRVPTSHQDSTSAEGWTPPHRRPWYSPLKPAGSKQYSVNSFYQCLPRSGPHQSPRQKQPPKEQKSRTTTLDWLLPTENLSCNKSYLENSSTNRQPLV